MFSNSYDIVKVWEQTQLFDQQLNNPKMVRPDHSELKTNTKVGFPKIKENQPYLSLPLNWINLCQSSAGRKRGKARRQWFHQLHKLQDCPSNHPGVCGSLQVLFPLISLTFIIIRSSKHIENSIWAEKLAGGSSDLTNTLGWGGFGNREDGSMSVSTWEHELRPSKDPASLSPLDSVVGQVIDLNSNPSRMLATETMI